MTKQAITDHQLGATSSALICSFGSIFRKLPLSAVQAIEPITNISTLPSINPPFEGLMVGQDESILPLFDFSAFLGEAKQTGAYSININTSKGSIRLRANGIPSLNASTFPEQEAIPFALDEIEAMIAPLAPASLQEKIDATEKVGQVIPERQLLTTRVGEQVVVFDASNIDFMERHAQSSALNHDASKRIITLQDGSLIKGISFGAYANFPDAKPTTENWSIGFAEDGNRIAVTVSQVIGFESIPLDQLYKIEESDQTQIWVNHPKFGPLKIFSVDSFNAKPHNKSYQEIEALLKSLGPSKTHTKKTDSIQKLVGVGLKFNGFSLVIPRELISSIKEEIQPSKLSQEASNNSMQVFDLTKLPGLERPMDVADAKLRAISLKHGNEEIVVLAPEIFEPSIKTPWSPIPALPSSLSKYIQAIRVEDGCCELLIKESLLTADFSHKIKPYADKIFCGWLTSN